MQSKTRFLLPVPKEASNIAGAFEINAASRILLRPAAGTAETVVAALLAEQLSNSSSKPLSTKSKESGASTANGISLELIADWKHYHTRDRGAEGYILEVRPDGVDLVATSGRGLFYAAQTLLQLRRDGSIPALRIVDWPDLPNRMAFYDMRGLTMSVPYWKHWINELSALKMNALMAFMTDDFTYKAYPFLGRPGTFNAEKALAVVEHAKSRFIDLVPQLESFGHADGVLSHPELKELRLGNGEDTCSPGTDATYDFFATAYHELCQAFPQSTLLHIGCDEVGGWGEHKWSLNNDPRLHEEIVRVGEEDIFARHINRLRQLALAAGRKAAMWGDEILWHPDLANKISHDTIIFDWHYEDTKDFPTLKKFKEWGFKTIYGAPAVHGFNDLYPQVPISFGATSPGSPKQRSRSRLPGCASPTGE